jgi:hypothetical protein
MQHDVDCPPPPPPPPPLTLHGEQRRARWLAASNQAPVGVVGRGGGVRGVARACPCMGRDMHGRPMLTSSRTLSCVCGGPEASCPRGRMAALVGVVASSTLSPCVCVVVASLRVGSVVWVRHAVVVCVRVWVGVVRPPFSPPTPCGTALPLACWRLLRLSVSHGRLRECGSERDALSTRTTSTACPCPFLRARRRCMLVNDLPPDDARGRPCVRDVSATCTARHAALLARLRGGTTLPEPVSMPHHRRARA